MSPESLIPHRVLMTVDAVGGVWRYAMDLVASLQNSNVQFLIAGVGPRPTAAAQAEFRSLDNVELVWTDTTLDWMADREGVLDSVAPAVTHWTRKWCPDLLHLNLPSQAV